MGIGASTAGQGWESLEPVAEVQETVVTPVTSEVGTAEAVVPGVEFDQNSTEE